MCCVQIYLTRPSKIMGDNVDKKVRQLIHGKKDTEKYFESSGPASCLIKRVP
jgi:hypothetical protein